MKTSVQRIDRKIQRGRGKAAKKLGQTYDVYRLGPTTEGCIVSGDPILSNYPARLRRITSRVAIEGEIFSLQCFEAVCDNGKLQIQDALLETGYEAQVNGIYIFAQVRPTRETLLMRAEGFVQIVRPTPTAGNPQQQPVSGFSAVEGFGGVQNATDEILTLVGGVYRFKSEGSPAAVPCGLQPLNRVRDGYALGIPTDQPRTHWLIYCPDTGGEQPQEQDIFKFPNGDSYFAQSVNPGITGLTGYVIIAEKRGSA